MDIDRINGAVRQCVRESLDSGQPLVTLDVFIARLRKNGWRQAEIQVFCNAVTRILVSIADPDLSHSG